MKSLRCLALLFSAMLFTSLAGAQIFYNNTGNQNLNGAFNTADEIADDTPFTGTQHVASFTFAYDNVNAVPVSATARFYGVNAVTGGVGDLVATIPIANLAPGTIQLVTVNLPESQQFDWTAMPGIDHLSNVSGGFVSLQFSGPDRNAGWWRATGESLDGFWDLTTGQFITFSGDTDASTYLQISNSTVASTLSSLILRSSTVKGGTNAFATVTLTAPAPAGGAVVRLKSGKPTLAQIPATVTIPEGATQAKVLVKTQPVKTTTIMILSATYNTGLSIINLTLTP